MVCFTRRPNGETTEKRIWNRSIKELNQLLKQESKFEYYKQNPTKLDKIRQFRHKGTEQQMAEESEQVWKSRNFEFHEFQKSENFEQDQIKKFERFKKLENLQKVI